MEIVGAEQEGVARGRLDQQGVDLDALVHADRAGDRVLLCDAIDLLAGEFSAFDKLVDYRVVVGDLRDASVAEQVMRLSPTCATKPRSPTKSSAESVCPCRV